MQGEKKNNKLIKAKSRFRSTSFFALAINSLHLHFHARTADCSTDFRGARCFRQFSLSLVVADETDVFCAPIIFYTFIHSHLCNILYVYVANTVSTISEDASFDTSNFQLQIVQRRIFVTRSSTSMFLSNISSCGTKHALSKELIITPILLRLVNFPERWSFSV